MLVSDMGLSSKQVSNAGFDWSKTLTIPNSPPLTMVVRRHQNQCEPLKCPRCDSADTKFCYYNNYNRSQPRHFCRACKRHWTRGGTLRNVPIGGGRKNKLLKRSSSISSRMIADQITVQIHNHSQYFPLLSHGDRKNLSEPPDQGMLHPPAPLQAKNLLTSGDLDGISYEIDRHGVILGSKSLSSCSFSSSCSSNAKPYQSSDAYNYYSQDQVKTIDQKPTISVPHRMHLSNATSSAMDDMTNYWNWEGMSTFVATDHNLRRDDSDL